MSYVCVIKHENGIMNKSEKFDHSLRDLARFARVISHPARLAILEHLSETQSCITSDISENLPLSRTTVSQHLKELRELGLIHGTVDGLKINYCLCSTDISKYVEMFNAFFNPMQSMKIDCKISNQSNEKNRSDKIIV
jgi:DNA-binding transcriptional ArsR family regulator